MARVSHYETSRNAVEAAFPALNKNDLYSFMPTTFLNEKPFRGQDLTGKKFGRLTVTLFLEDMESAYSNGLTLERKDSSRGYEPGNVVWATWQQQQQTKSGIYKAKGLTT